MSTSSSRTAKRVIHLNHLWTIENFNFFLHDRVVKSPTFSAAVNDGIQWYLRLYPSGEGEDSEGYVSAFLRLRSGPGRRVLLTFRMLILGFDGTPVGGASSSYTPYRMTPGKGRGFQRLIKQESLLNDHIRYLPGNKLTLHCDVWYAVDNADVPCPTSSPQTKTPACALSAALGELYASQAVCDATLILNEKEFPAHRAILSARSPFFKAMFERDVTEGKSSLVKIVDMDERTLTALLRFIYTGETDAPDNMANILTTINKHAIKVETTNSSARSTGFAHMNLNGHFGGGVIFSCN